MALKISIFHAFIAHANWGGTAKKEQLGNSEPFPVTNMPVHLINSEQIGFSEQLCDDQKVP